MLYGVETVDPPDGRIIAKRDAFGLPPTIFDGAGFKKGDVGQGYFLGSDNYCDVSISWPGKAKGTLVGCSGTVKKEPRKPKPPFDDWFTGIPAGEQTATSLNEYKGNRSYHELKNFAQRMLGPAFFQQGMDQVLV